MAYEILEGLEDSGSDSTEIVHATHHDLESLIYTLSYATYRYVYNHRHNQDKLPKMTPRERELFESDFQKFFGRASVSGIRNARRDLMQRPKYSRYKAQGERIFKHLPDTIGALCMALLNMLTDQYPGLLASSRSVPKDMADDPMIARLSQLLPHAVVLEDKRPPPVYMSCARVKEVVNAFITVYYPDADC